MFTPLDAAVAVLVASVALLAGLQLGWAVIRCETTPPLRWAFSMTLGSAACLSVALMVVHRLVAR